MTNFEDMGKKPQGSKQNRLNNLSNLEENTLINATISRHTPIKNLEIETSFKGREVVLVGNARAGEGASLQASDNTSINFLNDNDWIISQYDNFDLLKNTRNALVFDDTIRDVLVGDDQKTTHELFEKINFSLAAKVGLKLLPSLTHDNSLTTEERFYLAKFLGIVTRTHNNEPLSPNECEMWYSNLAREMVFKQDIPFLLDLFSDKQKEFLLHFGGVKTALYLGYIDKIYPTFPAKDMDENIECLKELASKDIVKRESLRLEIEENKRFGKYEDNLKLIDDFNKGKYQVRNPIMCFLAIESYYQDKNIEMSPELDREVSKFQYLYHIHRGQSILRNIEEVISHPENDGKKIIIFSKFINLNLHKMIIEASDELKSF